MQDGLCYFAQCLDIEVAKINPQTREIDDNEVLNTEVEVWLECGPYEFNEDAAEFSPTHDIDLDCGAPTFEKAIIELARLVKQKYGE